MTYVVLMRDRLQEMATLARENAQRAQCRQKKYYDRGTKMCELDVGDQVLVLLPMDRNRLKLEWSGPASIVEKVIPVDYRCQVLEGPQRCTMSISLRNGFQELARPRGCYLHWGPQVNQWL